MLNYKTKFKKPGSINYFVYNILDDNIQHYLSTNSNEEYFSSNLINSYLSDKENNNMENSYVWFRYYQINKLASLKKISMIVSISDILYFLFFLSMDFTRSDLFIF